VTWSSSGLEIAASTAGCIKTIRHWQRKQCRWIRSRDFRIDRTLSSPSGVVGRPFYLGRGDDRWQECYGAYHDTRIADEFRRTDPTAIRLARCGLRSEQTGLNGCQFDFESKAPIPGDAAKYLASCPIGDALLIQDYGKGVCTASLLRSLLAPTYFAAARREPSGIPVGKPGGLRRSANKNTPNGFKVSGIGCRPRPQACPFSWTRPAAGTGGITRAAP
jgi:hypothetical protein